MRGHQFHPLGKLSSSHPSALMGKTCNLPNPEAAQILSFTATEKFGTVQQRMASTAYAKQDQGRGRDVGRLADCCLGEERENERTKKADGGTLQGEEMRRKKHSVC